MSAYLHIYAHMQIADFKLTIFVKNYPPTGFGFKRQGGAGLKPFKSPMASFEQNTVHNLSQR